MLNLHNLKLNTKDHFGFAIQQNLGFKSWIFCRPHFAQKICQIYAQPFY